MTTLFSDEQDESARGIRIAVEGCGHGTLDAIYASILKACAVKGWDGVDLVIIGGDFQAVRDRRDLNVTAMPVKYRTMADFHQYYWGKKTAPFLTIFVGGNHEASNHLFELYYGGWVAPNIYYLGAANIIQVGPLKIAGMSGIWKGYDYRKPHYERLPYSLDDMYSIYHIRELDVRKLLAFRSQVDIGISHDWPKGIEWLGDHKRLFNHKMHLRADAESGKLGSVAAQQVMDHLRPPYWFSAHLHTKYAALKTYTANVGGKEQVGQHEVTNNKAARRYGALEGSAPPDEKLVAWNNFATYAQQEEAADTARLIAEEKGRRESVERTGFPPSANYIIDETYKKIKVENGLQRNVAAAYHERRGESQTTDLASSQIDGCSTSLPLKRRREQEFPPVDQHSPGIDRTGIHDTLADDMVLNSPAEMTTINPDAIDIDMSDDDEVPLLAGSSDKKEDARILALSPQSKHDYCGTKKVEASQAQQIQLDDSEDQKQLADEELWHAGEESGAPITRTASDNIDTEESGDTATGVSEEVRAHLATLSRRFEEPLHVSPPLPHPEDIRNESTRFLALSKSEDRQNFLQLLEIHPHKRQIKPVNRPLRLSYVPEWLAILKTFAPELSLGGRPGESVPQHRGDTFYRNSVVENEKWIQENVTEAGLTEIPENFVTTVDYSDPETSDAKEKPREVTNPQTVTFCDLIGIPNLFDITEEERDARMAAERVEQSHSDSAKRGGKQQGRGGRSARDVRGGRGGRGWNVRGRGGRRS